MGEDSTRQPCPDSGHVTRPAPPWEVTGGDRLVEHLRRELPESRQMIESAERQHGHANPMRVCERLSDAAVAAYRAGDVELGLRIATAVSPGLDESGELSARGCVVTGFLDNAAWHSPEMQPFVDRWPAPLRAELQRHQAAWERADRQAQAWSQLWRTARGQPVPLVEDQLRALGSYRPGDARSELHVALTARALSDPRWLYHHPLGALRLAWRHREVQSPVRTVRWLRRPRFAG